jgi:radical SAM protein with 4Fe4S-binding SPASM domain
MFAGDKTYRIGNITAANGESTLNSPVLQRIYANSKANNEDCRVCYARHLCDSCLGNNRIATGVIENMSPAFCDTVRAIAKEAVIGYAAASRSPELREHLASGKQIAELQASGCDAVAST